MKVSLNWVKSINERYGAAANPAPHGVDELVSRIGLQLGGVEEVIDLGKRYDGIVVAKVLSTVKHPNADKLSVCLIDDGKVIKGVERNKDGLVNVVCGAPNVKAGMLAAWIPPGVTVPATVDKDPFVLEAREIRGEISNGMLASPKELALGEGHEGILNIDQPAKPGEAFAKVYALDDYIIDIENKMFTHRPDLFGILGIAREIAGIQQQSFKSPDWYRTDASVRADGRNNGLKLEIKNEVHKLVPRFCAVAIKDVKVGDSPVWLQTYLARVGIRPINNIVDLTNFIMYETAQPLHVYDYDKLKTGVLGVRLSKKGEELKVLGGKNIKLDAGAIVITDGHKPIGLGGVMGGAGTEVDESTKNIILEVATFDQNITRKTAMTYGLFTDAATRFTKNQSPLQNMAVLAQAVEDIKNIAGGRVSSRVIDEKSGEVKMPNPVTTSATFINERLGTNLSGAEIKKLLQNVEFEVNLSSDKLEVGVPFWRRDIEIPEDIVEEVGRLYGYEHLPLLLPKRDLSAAQPDTMLRFKSRVRDILSRAGANEVLTYSFVRGTLFHKTAQDPKHAYKIRNAQSPDLQYYRLSLMPSLLDKVYPNIKAGYGEFALFEIGKAHTKERPLDDEGLPVEDEYTALVVAADTKHNPAGAAYYQARNYLAKLAGEELQFKPITKEMQKFQVMQPYQPRRSAMVSDRLSGKFLGIIGEFKPSVSKALKLPSFCAGFELDTSALLDVLSQPPVYYPLNRYPALEQDITLRLLADTPYDSAAAFLRRQLSSLSKPHGYQFFIKPLDIYKNPKAKSHVQMTWRVTLLHPERTLTTDETNKLLDELAVGAKKELKAERI